MNENRVSLKNSVQPEFIVHGRLKTTFYKQSKTTVMKIEFIDSEQKKKLEGMKMEQKFKDFCNLIQNGKSNTDTLDK